MRRLRWLFCCLSASLLLLKCGKTAYPVGEQISPAAMVGPCAGILRLALARDVRFFDGEWSDAANRIIVKDRHFDIELLYDEGRGTGNLEFVGKYLYINDYNPTNQKHWRVEIKALVCRSMYQIEKVYVSLHLLKELRIEPEYGYTAYIRYHPPEAESGCYVLNLENDRIYRCKNP